MINRKKLVTRHNPILTKPRFESPLTIGNGEFAFTADITGLQTFYNDYLEPLPLCIQSQWGWHSKPYSKEQPVFTRNELELTYFETYGRSVGYAKEPQAGNEHVYDWLRKNPHRMNLARISFVFEDSTGTKAAIEDIQSINQTLDMYTGILESNFEVFGNKYSVRTCCHPKLDLLAVNVDTNAHEKISFGIEISFPYPNHKKSGSDWSCPQLHQSKLESTSNNAIIKRTIDNDSYNVVIGWAGTEPITMSDNHSFMLKGVDSATFGFSPNHKVETLSFNEVMNASMENWREYWEKGGMVELASSKDPRGFELERRIVLSQYLLAIQSAGTIPPQETGLTCNSWYGKFHLEMHYWHASHFHYWGKTKLLENSIGWYQKRLPEAKALAKSQGYKGARWQKMLAENGIDTPSTIAPLLIWQQPHLILFLEWCYQNEPTTKTLEKYKELMDETATFMADFVHYDKANDRYVLGPPVIPAQERHDPATCLNPTYELEYWIVGLSIAQKWRKRLDENPNSLWDDIITKMAQPPQNDGLYISQENCPDTFVSANDDHPSMLCAYGMLPPNRIDPKIMSKTLDKVLEVWDYSSLWGWDFGVMAMTATLLDRPDVAIDCILKDTIKNTYEINGNNHQMSRTDLPLYLPGNGSLLLAIAMMIGGYEGCKRDFPGFPNDGNWTIAAEGIRPFWW